MKEASSFAGGKGRWLCRAAGGSSVLQAKLVDDAILYVLAFIVCFVKKRRAKVAWRSVQQAQSVAR